MLGAPQLLNCLLQFATGGDRRVGGGIGRNHIDNGEEANHINVGGVPDQIQQFITGVIHRGFPFQAVRPKKELN